MTHTHIAHHFAQVAGRRAVVIGGTAGIGKGIALRLAEAQVFKLALCRKAIR
jgi:NAD(P)-dependent dehydrogenase (short-subunit alcohol dehydrogenase family)